MFQACLRQARKAGSSLIGMMVESHLHAGSQPIPKDLKDTASLQYGVSVTDKCLGWATTERMILDAARPKAS